MNLRKTVTLKTKRGFNLTGFEGDSITREVQEKGEYDGNTLDSIKDLLELIMPNVSLDVGANIGNHTLLISQYTKKLVSFEPVKFVFDVLTENVNHNASNVSTINLGLSNINSAYTINIPNNGNLGSSSIEVASENSEPLEIKAVIGDQYLKDNFENQSIDFIKMDIEGHEAMALTGLKDTIHQYQPLILIEWKSPQTLTKFKELQLIDKLFSGYEKYSLSHTTNKKVHPKSIYGFFGRLYHKVKGSAWCLSNFDPDKEYSNVYFVPERYQELLKNNEFKKKIRVL
jgi:FkbM family methyltransferase